jgi:hypothetical protein
MIVHSAKPRAFMTAEIAQSTSDDPELQELNKWMRTDGKKEFPRRLVAYKHVANELSTTESGILLRGNRILIPSSLRARVVDLANNGHQGIVKTKALIGPRVWFPGIDRQVENKINKFRECQANTGSQSYEPLHTSEMPAGPWQSVSGDFYGPMSDGKYWYVNHCERRLNKFVLI